MKFSFLTASAPGDGLSAQCNAIARAGCDGIETLVFSTTSLDDWQVDIRKAARDNGLEIAVVIIGGLALNKPGQMGWIKEALHAVSELGAGALVTPEYAPQDPLPLMPPYALPPEKEQANVDMAIEEMAKVAEKLKLHLFFEPITPFQSRFWRDTDTVLSLCQRLNNPYVGLALDFWVMNLTEVNITESIRKSGSFVHHIHLADNNRLLPGQGHIDFSSGIRTLKELGYSGWYSFECAVLGDFTQQVNTTLRLLRNMAGVRS